MTSCSQRSSSASRSCSSARQRSMTGPPQFRPLRHLQRAHAASSGTQQRRDHLAPALGPDQIQKRELERGAERPQGGAWIDLEAEQPRQMGRAGARRMQALAALTLDAAGLDQVREAALDEGGGGREAIAAHDLDGADQLVGQRGAARRAGRAAPDRRRCSSSLRRSRPSQISYCLAKIKNWRNHTGDQAMINKRSQQCTKIINGIVV